MKLGGWTRIWVVTCVLYAVVIAFVISVAMPSTRSVYREWFADASTAIAQGIKSTEKRDVEPYQVENALLNKSRAENVAFLEKVENSPTENQKVFSSQVTAVNSKYRKILSGSPQRRLVFGLEAFGWWLGGALALYALGWSIGWVVRGFRSNAA
jgi:hypothetical protein